MKIISNDELNRMVAINAQNCKNIGLNNKWLKIQWLISTIAASIAIFLGIKTFDYYEKDILSFMQVDTLEFKHKIIIGIICMIAILLMNIPLVIIHEAIHAVTLPKGKDKKYVIFTLPFTISVHYDGWIPRNSQLKCLIAPVIVISIMIALLAIAVGNIYIFFWLMLLNISLSSSDIFAFFYILSTIPQEADLYGGYFRC